jgi:hypothetical protein
MYISSLSKYPKLVRPKNFLNHSSVSSGRILYLAGLFHDIADLAALAVIYAISSWHLSQKAIADLYQSYDRLFATIPWEYGELTNQSK